MARRAESIPHESAPHVVGVAYSGGRDSTALLHATLVAARGQGVHVAALHVHHGLSAHADAWLAHCEAQCLRWAKRGLPVSLHAEHLHLVPGRGDSLEALAREARYAALQRLAEAAGARLVMLAHHRRDQAETFLLQALRGAGVAGLSGMPTVIERGGIIWARPWLGQPRERVEAYVRRHRLAHIEDDSNADPRFARNRLRLQLWPVLSSAFAQAESTLADAATWAQEAAACIADLAEQDIAPLLHGDALDVERWATLPAHRARNALRHWVRSRTGQALTAAELARLCVELPGRAPAQWSLGAGTLRRYRGRLSIEPAMLEAQGMPPREQSLSIRRAGRYPLPGWGGELVVQRVREGGAPLSWLADARLVGRMGGEQFQQGPNRPPRALKKQYQAAGIPAWAREGPLLYAHGVLVFAPGLGVDARVWGPAGAAQVSVAWVAAGGRE